MFCIVLEKSNMLYILKMMNKWDKYFYMVYNSDLHHHHKNQNYKDKIYQVEVFFEKIKDR